MADAVDPVSRDRDRNSTKSDACAGHEVVEEALGAVGLPLL